MRGIRVGWWSAFLLLVSACAHESRARPPAEEARPVGAGVDEDLYAAIVRGTVTHFGQERDDQTLHCLVICVERTCNAPSEQLLTRFASDRFVVAAPDACKWEGGGVVPARSTFVHISGGRRETRAAPPRAMYLEVESVRFASPERVEASSSIVYGNVGANGLSLELVREGGQWKVVKTEGTWIS